MATIVDTYPYVDGTVLNATNHNLNLYHPTSPGGGILSEFEGHIETENFDPAFMVTSRHISPGAMVWTASREATITRDYYGDIFGGTANFQYITIDAVRFRVPFDSAVALLSISSFISPVLWRTSSGDQETPVETNYHNARTALFFNNVKDVESEFALPHNAPAALAGAPIIREIPGRYAVPRAHFKLITDASSLTAGTFEVGFKLAIDAETNEPCSVSYPKDIFDNLSDPIARNLYARVTIGAVAINAVFFKTANP